MKVANGMELAHSPTGKPPDGQARTGTGTERVTRLTHSCKKKILKGYTALVLEKWPSPGEFRVWTSVVSVGWLLFTPLLSGWRGFFVIYRINSCCPCRVGNAAVIPGQLLYDDPIESSGLLKGNSQQAYTLQWYKLSFWKCPRGLQVRKRNGQWKQLLTWHSILLAVHTS